jgi:hypothetical protein
MGGKMKIYRNAEGKCVNIGDWDYQIVVIDGVETIRNPLPEGVVESDEEVIVGWDGGRYVHNDPRAVKS